MEKIEEKTKINTSKRDKGSETKKFEEKIQILYLQDKSDIKGLLDKLIEIDKEFRDFCILDDNEGAQNGIIGILQLLKFPLTIIYEPYYVDRIYRDEYYRYYSKKHFYISRNTKRLIFVQNIHEKTDFISDEYDKYKEIEEDLIGMVVLKPTRTIGRTLLKPSKLENPRCYIRTTLFEMSVYGKIYSLDAFPFSGQDNEVMTCAEVNIWQMMEYFGNRYKDYKTLLPSELVDLVKESSDTRILPSDGLTVEQESFLFMKAGLSPIIYYRFMEYQESDAYRLCEQYTEPSFFEILHFYIESGIPVLINLRDKNNPKGENHSITCVGHEHIKMEDLPLKMEEIEITVDRKELDKDNIVKYNKISVLKSWSGYKRYVMMEDHSAPYQVKELDNLIFSNFLGDDQTPIAWEIESFVAPLYKHVFLAAEDAYEISLKLIQDNFEDISKAIACDLKNDIPQIIIRLYLTTSKSYKNFRIQKAAGKSERNLTEKFFFSQVDYPKFLWICEYSTVDMYSQHRAIGEFVLDATSSKDYSIISIRHGEKVTYRSPVGDKDDAYVPTELKLPETFAIYESNNLKDSGYL